MSKGPVEEFTVSGGQDTSATTPDPAAPTRRPGRGPAAWVSFAVVLVLLGAALAQPLQLGADPWSAVPDVTSVPQQAWTVQPEEDVHLALLADGVLVTAGVQTVRGRDPGSGAELWARELVGARCTSDGENLVCTDSAAQVLQIEPRSGAATELEVPQALVVTVADGDVFALTSDGQLQRRSGGEVIWSAPVSVATDFHRGGQGLTVIAGYVLTTQVLDPANFGASGAVFDAATGQPWERTNALVLPLDAGVWVVSHADGGSVFVHGADEPRTANGVLLQYDDQWRSSQQVTTTDDEQLGVLDRESGDLLWRTDYPAYPLARAGGVILALASAEQGNVVRGVQAGSGELLWERSNAWLTCPCLSDGSTLTGHLVTVGADGSANPEQAEIIGLDLRSGAQLWSLPRPPTTLATLTDGEHLVLAAAAELSGWRLG